MKILWISSLAWNSGQYVYPVNGPGAVSGSLFQQQLITGLRKSGNDIDIIADYPYAQRADRNRWNNASDFEGDHIVIPSCTSYIKEKLVKGELIVDIIKEQLTKKKYDYVVAYLIHTPYMEALKYAKKQGMKTVLICPDLPDMMDMSLKEKKIKRILKSIDMRVQHALYRYVDGFVLFTKHMIERLPIEDKPYTVIEGVASVEELDISDVKKEKAIMHAGTLHKNIGIENIISAFKLIPDKDIKLWIFGDGELRPYIEKAEQEDSRIKYFGFVDRNGLFTYEKKALALINARNPVDDYTKYSFPSKTFEYLYSGTVFITTWLKGMPEEYKKHVAVLKNNHPESIADMISDLLEGNVKIDSNINREFILKEKCAEAQAKKMVDLLKQIR